MFRRITKDDRALYLSLAREFYASPAVLHGVPDAYLQRTFDEAVRSDTYAEIYILGEGGGYALLAKSFSQEAGGPVVWLDEFYVREEARGQGLGKEFLRFLTERYGKTARLRLETEPENVRAEKLYRSHGFALLPYKQFVREAEEQK